ncbi:MAG: hypothetical protein VB128_03500 [Sedimentibacter saalensis]|uniref:hypothetical protein n=1 Tax=Sedimentibacter saalensis TaxID=130788 RepID=UPI002B220DE5|nr:hypothetical protein [Sedimentibacter saalensis]MEA5094001.1 hypothetical protein [Sedimentibacter saalensis]
MRKIKLLRKKFIFICIIFSMSITGVGYAAWNDDAAINLSYKTGFIDPVFIMDSSESIITVKNGALSLTPSQNGNTLIVKGEVYPDFNENILVKIMDDGTIPTVFNELSEKKGNVSELNINKNINKNIESFTLNISPNNDEELMQLYESFSTFNEESSSLEQQIEILREKINYYSKERKYEFEYKLSFEQGL